MTLLLKSFAANIIYKELLHWNIANQKHQKVISLGGINNRF